MTMRDLSLIATLVWLSACADSRTNAVPEGIRVAAASDVNNCRLLGDVHGVSSMYGVMASKGMASARQAAFTQARELGANTLVWQQFTPTHGSTSASGLAYACP